MRLKYPCLAAVGAVLISSSVWAAAPPSAPGYQVNLGLGPGGPNYVYGQVPMWLDTTTMLAGVNGPTPLPRPVSDQSPLPVTVMGGSGGGAGGGYTPAPATYTQTAVTVPANTSTPLIGANATRKHLDLIPTGGNQTCLINDAGGTASATSKPIPGGWSFDQTDPPPAGAVTAYCTAAATISVTEGN